MYERVCLSAEIRRDSLEPHIGSSVQVKFHQIFSSLTKFAD